MTPNSAPILVTTCDGARPGAAGIGKRGLCRQTRRVTTSPSQLTIELAADWRARAACSGHLHTLFFPIDGPDDTSTERARAICMSCPVSDECLEYALETNQRAGIWGGTTEDERKSLRRKWMAARRRAS